MGEADSDDFLSLFDMFNQKQEGRNLADKWRIFRSNLRAVQKLVGGYPAIARKGSFKDLKTLPGLAFGSTLPRREVPLCNRHHVLREPENTPEAIGPGTYEVDKTSIAYRMDKKITSTKGGILADKAKRGVNVYDHLLGNPSAWDYDPVHSNDKHIPSARISQAPRKSFLTDIKNNNPPVGYYAPEKVEIGKSLPTTEAFGTARKVISGTHARCVRLDQLALQKCVTCSDGPKNSYYAAPKPAVTYQTEKQFESFMEELTPDVPYERVMCSHCYKHIVNMKYKYHMEEYAKPFKKVSGCAQYHDHAEGMCTAVTKAKTYEIAEKKRIEAHLAHHLDPQ